MGNKKYDGFILAEEDDMPRIKQKKLNLRALNNATVGKGLKFSVKVEDLDWPDICPVLGIPIEYRASRISDNSPSFDRVDNNKPYIKGNVVIISNRANRIKNDGTAEEHRKIAAYMDYHLGT
jgi:hypothetical protein